MSFNLQHDVRKSRKAVREVSTRNSITESFLHGTLPKSARYARARNYVTSSKIKIVAFLSHQVTRSKRPTAETIIVNIADLHDRC